MLPTNSTLSPSVGPNSTSPEASPRLPVTWHAPEQPRQAESSPDTDSVPLIDVRVCISCGFPVSETRTLCLECEANSAASTLPRPLSGSLDQESWLRAHGYTIASLLVTLLTAALIWWLRR